MKKINKGLFTNKNNEELKVFYDFVLKTYENKNDKLKEYTLVLEELMNSSLSWNDLTKEIECLKDKVQKVKVEITLLENLYLDCFNNEDKEVQNNGKTNRL